MVALNCKNGCKHDPVRWWLTTDSNMDYTVFRGTQPPTLDRLSGRNRWYGNGQCQMVMTSVGSPEIISNIFGIALDAMQCVEIDPMSMKCRAQELLEQPQGNFGQSQQVQSQSIPVQAQQNIYQQGNYGGGLNVVGLDEPTAIPICNLNCGDWFKMTETKTGEIWLGCIVDQGQAVMYTPSGPLMLGFNGMEMCTPVDVYLEWQRRPFPGGDVQMN